jgi:hypothetical protein
MKQMLANALFEIISNFSRIIDFLAQSRKDEATCRRSFFFFQKSTFRIHESIDVENKVAIF